METAIIEKIDGHSGMVTWTSPKPRRDTGDTGDTGDPSTLVTLVFDDIDGINRVLLGDSPSGVSTWEGELTYTDTQPVKWMLRGVFREPTADELEILHPCGIEPPPIRVIKTRDQLPIPYQLVTVWHQRRWRRGAWDGKGWDVGDQGDFRIPKESIKFWCFIPDPD